MTTGIRSDPTSTCTQSSTFAMITSRSAWQTLPLELRQKIISHTLNACLRVIDVDCKKLATTLLNLIFTSFSFGQENLRQPLYQLQRVIEKAAKERISAMIITVRQAYDLLQRRYPRPYTWGFTMWRGFGGRLGSGRCTGRLRQKWTCLHRLRTSWT